VNAVDMGNGVCVHRALLTPKEEDLWKVSHINSGLSFHGERIRGKARALALAKKIAAVTDWGRLKRPYRDPTKWPKWFSEAARQAKAIIEEFEGKKP
jgi:hypothetical protein